MEPNRFRHLNQEKIRLISKYTGSHLQQEKICIDVNNKNILDEKKTCRCKRVHIVSEAKYVVKMMDFLFPHVLTKYDKIPKIN